MAGATSQQRDPVLDVVTHLDLGRPEHPETVEVPHESPVRIPRCIRPGKFGTGLQQRRIDADHQRGLAHPWGG